MMSFLSYPDVTFLSHPDVTTSVVTSVDWVAGKKKKLLQVYLINVKGSQVSKLVKSKDRFEKFLWKHIKK